VYAGWWEALKNVTLFGEAVLWVVGLEGEAALVVLASEETAGTGQEK